MQPEPIAKDYADKQSDIPTFGEHLSESFGLAGDEVKRDEGGRAKLPTPADYVLGVGKDLSSDYAEFKSGIAERGEEVDAKRKEAMKDLFAGRQGPWETTVENVGHWLSGVVGNIGETVGFAAKAVASPQTEAFVMENMLPGAVEGVGESEVITDIKMKDAWGEGIKFWEENIKDPATGNTLGQLMEDITEARKDPTMDRQLDATFGYINAALEITPLIDDAGRVIRSLDDLVALGSQKATNVVQDLRAFQAIVKQSKKPKAEIMSALDSKTINMTEAEFIAAEMGIELPASSVTGNVASTFEQSIGEGPFGGVVRKKRETAIKKFDEVMTTTQQKAATSGDLGAAVSERFTEVEKQHKSVINSLYDSAEEIANDANLDIYFYPESNTVKYLDELIERKMLAEKGGVSVADTKDLQRIREAMKSKKTLATQRAVLKEIGNKANFSSYAPTPDEKMYRQLYRTMKDDLNKSIGKAIPGLDETLKVANRKFSDFEKIKARPFVKTIKKLSDQGDFDKIAEKLTKEAVSANEIKTMYEVLGPNLQADLQAKFMDNIIQTARSKSGEGFMPQGFSRQLMKIGDEKMAAIFTEPQRLALQHADTLNKALARSTSVSRGSQTAKLQQYLPIFRTLAGAATAGTSLLGEFILSRIIAGKKGQQLLRAMGGSEYKEAVKTFRAMKRGEAGAAKGAGIPKVDLPQPTGANKAAGGTLIDDVDMSAVERAVEQTKEGSGFTIKIDGKDVKEGFAYSPFPERTLALSNKEGVTGKVLNDYYSSNLDLLGEEGHYLGGWFDEKTGEFVLDIAVVDNVFEDAIIKAKKYDQDAIYDLGATGDGTRRTADYDEFGKPRSPGGDDGRPMGGAGGDNAGGISTDRNNPARVNLPGAKSVSDADVVDHFITQKIANGEDVLIDSDQIKTFLGSVDDTAPDFHPESTRLVQELYREALKVSPSKYVDFTAGGSGSGKSEVILNKIKGDGNIIMDGTLADYDKAAANIQAAIDAGKTPRISAVYADFTEAKEFAKLRGRKIGKGKDGEKIFLNKHKDFRASLKRISEEFPEAEIDLYVNSKKTGQQGHRLRFDRETIKSIIDEMSTHLTIPERFKS